MSKKNNKKNSTRKSYKIESLEPRLMMDAAASQWLEEIDSIALSETAVTALGDDNFYSRTNWNSKGDVTGLYLQDEESGEVESVSKADFIDAVNDKTKGSIKATDTINIIKKNLKQAVEKANGGKTPSKDSDGNWLNDNVLSAQDILNAFVQETDEDCSLSVGAEGNQISVMISDFGLGISPDKFGSYIANLGERYNLESEYDFRGVNQRIQCSLNLDGSKLTDNGLVASRYATALFDENPEAETKYGVLGLIADQGQPEVDLYEGTFVRVTNATSAIEYGDGILGVFDYALKDANTFNSGLSTNLNLTILESGMYWNNPVVAGFGEISMGKILCKLQELSSKLAEIQSEMTQSKSIKGVDFGGVLAQNANSLLNLTAMLEGVLNSSPKTVQELILALNGSKYKSAPVAASVDANGNLVIPFHLHLNESNNVVGKKDDGSDLFSNLFDVAISKKNLSDLFGLEVLINDSVKIESKATLDFSLVVPLRDVSVAGVENSLEEIGVLEDDAASSEDDTVNQIASVVYGNVAIGGNDIGYDRVTADSNKKNFIDEIEAYLTNSGKSTVSVRSLLGDYSNYVIYVDDTSVNFIPSGLSGELANVSWKTGFCVICPSSVHKIAYGSKEYRIGTIRDIESVLNSLFAQYSEFDGASALCVGVDVVVFCNSSQKEYLKKIVLNEDYYLPVDLEKNFFVSKEISPEKYSNAFDVTIKDEKGVEIKKVIFEEGLFNGITSVGDIVTTFQNRISISDLMIESYGRKLRFCSAKGYTVVFSDDDVARWLGFSSKEVSLSASGKTDCMEIKLENETTPISIKLPGLTKNSKIEEILDAVVLQCKGKIVRNGLYLVGVDGHKIESIKDVNGFSIASQLGLTGSIDTGKKNFKVDATLTESAQIKKDSSSVARFDALTLSITNFVKEGNVDVSGQYGVFGVDVVGDLTGASCESKFNLNMDNEEGLFDSLEKLSSVNQYNAKSETSLSVNLKKDLAENSETNLGNYETSGDDSKLVIDFIKNDGLKGAEVTFGPEFVTINSLYTSVREVLSEKLMSYLFGDSSSDEESPSHSFLCDIDLPLQGKNVLEIMGLRSKITEMAKCLEQGQFKTVQELSAYFKDNLGVSFLFSLTENGIGIDIEWTKVVEGQATELGGMNFGIEGFNLGGSLEAYQNVNLKFTAHIDYKYDLENKKYVAVLDVTDEKPTVIGTVNLWADNIVTDMNICVLEKGASKQLLVQVGANQQAKSWLSMFATVSSDSVAVFIGGELYVFRYGIDAGKITIGSANSGGFDDLSFNTPVTYSSSKLPNSVAVWNGDTGVCKSSDSVKTGDIVVNLTHVTEKLREVFLYEKLRQVADGLSDTVRRVQSNLNGVLLKKTVRNIPLIGDSIVNAADSLTGLYTQLVEPFRNYVYKSEGLTAQAVSEKLYMLLKGSLEDLGEPSASGVQWAGETFKRYYKGIQFSESNDRACWRMRLKGSYELEKNGDFDIGFSGLGLKAEGGVKIELEWFLDIGFGVSLKDGAFLLLSNGYVDKYNEVPEFEETSDGWHLGDDFRLKIKVMPQASEINGKLGFLSMKGILQDQHGFDLKLGLDLNDGQNNENESKYDDRGSDRDADKLINFTGLKSGLSTEANLEGDIDLGIKLILGIGGNTDVPHIDANFNVEWHSIMGEGFGTLDKVVFSNIVFDCGKFVHKTVGSVVKNINRVLDPVRPLIDFLQAEIPVLNKLPACPIRITVLDLIKKYGESKGMKLGFLDDIVAMDSVLRDLQQVLTNGLSIGNWIVYDKKFDEVSRKIGLQYLNGMVSNVSEFLQNDEVSNAFSIGSVSKFIKNNGSGWDESSSESVTFKTDLLDGKWKIPLLHTGKARSNVMALMMGGDVDLIKFDMSPLEFNFDWRKSFAIVGPLFADIGFNFGVNIDLCFGYDSYGLRKWVNSGCKDYGQLLNGFYIDDLDENGKDVAEVVFHSGIVAGASVCGRAGINVGLNFNINMDFIDPNCDGKIRLGELADMASFNPLDMFDLSATIEAEAFAYLDLVFYRKEWTLWSSGAFELFNTAKKSNDAILAKKIDNQGLFVCAGEYAEYQLNGNLTDGEDVVVVNVVDENHVKVTVNDISNDSEYEVTTGADGRRALYIYGGKCNDSITVHCADNVNAAFDVIVYGGEGNDVIDLSGLALANGFYTVLVGGSGGDTIKGASGHGALNIIFGEEGVYRVDEDSDKKRRIVVEGIPTESGADTNTIYGGDAVNVVMGGVGKDVINGGNFLNYLFGDFGRWKGLVDFSEDVDKAWLKDVKYDRFDLYDEGGVDTIIGGQGLDFIFAGAGADRVNGMAGNDVIFGGQGNDILYGGSGSDQINGDDGVDIIFGDSPADKDMIIAKKDGTAGVLPYGYVSRELTNNGTDEEVKLSGDIGVEANVECGNDIIDGGNGSDVIFGDDGSNEGNGGIDSIKGGSGNDFIDGDGGNDTIDGGSGDDVIYGGLGADTLDGGADNDIVFGDNGWADFNSPNTSSSNWFNDDVSDIFGDTIKAFSKNFGVQQDTALSNKDGGNDKIIAGSGHDIVDGQGGNDSYQVNFMGGYNNAYTNIIESGDDAEDSLNVNATIKDDKILIRASDNNLGLIALLPDDADKTKLERINFWKVNGREFSGLENVSVNAGAGNDKIAVDGTLSTLSIDAGAGDDTINIGQLFETKRDSDANVLPLDRFDGSSIETTQGFLSEGPSHATSVVGGAGKDTFNVLHTNAAISLSGGTGNDSFNIASYTGIDKNGKTYSVENGPVTVIGGAGTDTTSINGTEADDTFVFTNGTVYSSNVDVQSVGIENYNVAGGAGDDSFYVLDTKDDSVINIYGNDGNDSFYNGGDQIGDDEVEKKIVIRNEAAEEASQTAQNIEILFTDDKGNSLEDLSFTLNEDDKQIVGYGIKLSKAPKDGEVVRVTVFVPKVSEENHQRGDCGVYFVENGCYSTSLTFEFNKLNYSDIQYVNLVAFKDSLREGNDYFALLHNVVVSPGSDKDASKVNTCRNMMVYFEEEKLVANKSRTVEVRNEFTVTEQYVVTGFEQSDSDGLNFVIKGLQSLPDLSKIQVWLSNPSLNGNVQTAIEDNGLKLSWNKDVLPVGTVIYYNYGQISSVLLNDQNKNTSGIVLEDQSVAQMKYNVESSEDVYVIAIPVENYVVKINESNPEFSTVYDNSKLTISKKSDELSSEVFNQGGQIRYWTTSEIKNKTEIALGNKQNYGFDNVVYIPDEESSSTEEYSYMVAQSGCAGYYVIENETIKFFDTDGNQKSLSGKVAYRTVGFFDARSDCSSIEIECSLYVNKEIEIQFYTDYTITPERNNDNPNGYYYQKAGNQIVICSNSTGKPITLSGNSAMYGDLASVVYDVERSNVPFGKTPDSITINNNTIENIKGNLFEDGAGLFGNFANSPLMLRYKKIDADGDVKAETNECVSSGQIADRKKREDIVKATNVDESKSVDRIFVNNMDNNRDSVSSMSLLSDSESDDSLNSDSGYADSKDALVESDKHSILLAHADTIDSESNETCGRNISFGNMEYGEINLGTGEDTVDINKSIYREDGFQTFTVVNSGKGVDTVNVNSYKDGSDDQLVINAGEGDDHVFATNKNVKKKGLIVFGGLGDDEIKIKSESSVVFGDRGQVLYHDAKGNVVTRLGDDKTGTFIGKEKGVARNAGGSDYATGKKKGDEAYYQTDGTRYGASIARTVTEEQGGNDTITLGGGRNVVFGGENKNEVIDKDEKLVVSKYGIDNITTGNGDDFILGDNGYTTFQGRSDVAKGLDMENMPTIYEESTISFNFQGDAQNGFEANDSVGAPGYESKNWVNIKGSLASTYGNDDSEIVRFDNGTRASAISLSYNGNEDLRFSSSDNAINLQTYNHWLSNRDQDNAAKLMNSGLMSTAPNNQNGNKVNVAIDGLAQYYESYKVVVYLDLPDANSWEHQSVRIVSLFIDGKREQAYYVNDPAPENFKGSFENHAVRAILNSDGSIKGVKRIKDKDGVEVETVEPIDDEFGRAMLYSNYVVFDVGANIASDRIVIRVEDGIQDPNYNGKDIPGIAAIQIKGVHHKQDVAATTNIDFGGRDVIHSGRGDDIVAGGTDADTIETFGDDHRGIDDNDIVFGDNAKMVFVDRDNNVETASMISSAESIAVKNLGVSYNDVIDTGDGNDTVVGGVGQDTIHSGATAAAEDMQDGVKALSINFTRDDADDSMKIREATYETKIVEGEVKFVYDGHGKKVIKTSGETAGVVADNDWHNMYVKNRELHEFADYSSHTVDGVDVAISSYANPWQEYWADNASMTNNISDELDGDTSNSKLYHNYLAAQKQEEIKLTLDHLDTFRSHNGLKSGAYCDLYVYLGGDNNDVHIYDHIYDISLTWYDKSGNKCKTEHRFLNDWTGYNFDGDYKEAYCTSYTEAVDMLHKDSAVCVRIIGNYVVFHNISVDKVDVRIKNVYTHTRGNQNPNENGEQNPKNLPLINAVQIVAGSGKEDAAIGGDHDKDLVFGDDAKLTFDIDVPYAVDEKMADYKNRVVEAESVAIADNVVKKLSTDDIIDTGKDRDVVVGGEGSDNITTGSGDDIAIGGSANLMVEHNNPLGVFTPSVEIVLDQHTIDTNNHQGYLDHHCNNPQEAEQAVRDFQGLLDQGQIKGIQIIDNKNDRLNTFDLGEGRDLQSTGSNDPSELVNQNDDEEQNGNQGSENPVINEDDQIDYDKTVISPVACAQLNLVANEKVKLVLESYPKSDDYTPNLWVFVSPQVPGQSFEDVCIELYSDGKLFSYDIEGGFWKSQDVPDHIDGDPTFKDGNCVVYVSSKVNTNVTVQVTEGG